MFFGISKIKTSYLFILIIVIAAVLRLYNLDKVPPSLSRDEVSIGYNAYSLLKTGKDEYGRFLPLAFEAFGDWKLPLNIYLAVPFIAIFGLTEIAVRLPVALFGVLSVILIYFLAEEIQRFFQKKLLTTHLSTTLPTGFSLLTAFFLAVSPWHIYMSRTAFGHDVLALFFFLLGAIFFLKSFKKQRSLILSGIFFSTTIFIYTSYHIFLPLYLIGIIILFRQKLIENKYFKQFIFIIVSLYFLSQLTLWQANITKISGSSVFNDARMIYYRIERKQNEHHNDTVSKIFHNKILTIPYQVGLNYLSAFSPQFLFDKGGENPINNLEETGNLYLIDALFILPGLYFLIRHKNIQGNIFWLLLLWLLLSPLPGAITRDAPHSTRTFAIVGVLVLIEAYGVVNIISSFWQVPTRSGRVQNPSLSDSGVLASPWARFVPRMTIIGICLLLMLSYVISITGFLENYFYHFPLNRARFWGYGFKQAVELSEKLNPKKVIISKLYDSPYIYFLFYQKYDSQKYQKEAIRAPLTWDGYRPVMGFSKFEFVDRFDWNHVWDSQDTLYIDAVENIPENYPINGWINYPFGDKAYGWFLTRGNPCRFVYPDRELTPKICR